MTAPQPAPSYRTFPYPHAQRQAVDRSELMSRQHAIHAWSTRTRSSPASSSP
jgi:hypothetical protein